MSIISKEEKLNTEKIRSWADIPFDIMDLIVHDLSLVDRIRLGSVCKSWRWISDAIRNDVKPWPKLIYLPDSSKGLFKYFDPLEGHSVSVEREIPVDSCLDLCFSKDGWTVFNDEGSVYIVNIFALEEEIVELPMHFFCCFDGVSFSSVPTSLDFTLMGISGSLVRESQIDVYFWRYGEDEWTQEEFKSNLPFLVGCNNPVFHEGLFYCLGREGNLGVYNPKEETWTVLDKPRPRPFLRGSHCFQAHDCYLVESSKNKDLMSVFVFNDGERVTVSRLDKSDMAWKNVQDLGDEMIFVDARSSISIISPSKETGNRIYLPRFSDGAASKRGGGVYYSLKTKKLHTYSEHHDVQVRTDCVWVMPPF